jgi:hypothetical protein
MTDKQIMIDGKGCRYKTCDKDCVLTGDNHGDNMKPCKFIDEKIVTISNPNAKNKNAKN